MNTTHRNRPPAKTTVRIEAIIAEEIAQEMGNLSAGAGRCVAAYWEIRREAIKEIKAIFTPEEILRLLHEVKELYKYPRYAQPTMKIEEQTRAKLDALTSTQGMVILEWLMAYWEIKTTRTPGEYIAT